MTFHRGWFGLVFILTFAVAHTSVAETSLDAERISDIVGVPAATTPDGVVRVAWPRNDVPLRVDGLAVRAAMGLGTWAAFQAVPGAGAMVMGDTVVFEDEVNPALDAVLAGGLEVTALHNHFLFDDPAVYFMHIGGRGDAEDLAAGVRHIWDAVRGVREQAPVPSSRFSGEVPTHGQLDTEALERIIGASGGLQDGVFKISIGRDAEMDGVAFRGSMGLTTWVAFAGSDELAAVDGDFAMTAHEVRPVLAALRAADINIVALHNHMIGETPTFYFVHFWGKGPAASLARGLRSALDVQRDPRGQAQASKPSQLTLDLEGPETGSLPAGFSTALTGH